MNEHILMGHESPKHEKFLKILGDVKVIPHMYINEMPILLVSYEMYDKLVRAGVISEPQPPTDRSAE